MNNNGPCMLMILDGWGINPQKTDNAVAMAGTPFLEELAAGYPTTQLLCMGKAVGLPAGIMGNSEVGHLNIGAGRVVYQNLLRIDQAITDGTFARNEAFTAALDKVAANNAALHLMGLVSDGGVHSHLSHLIALLDTAHTKGLSRVFVHAILDGRDTPPESGAGYITELQEHLDKIGTGTIASICGRYYAMDRDKRWDRIQKAFELYTQAKGTAASNPVAAVKDAYRRGETDEFVKPVFLAGENAAPLATIQDEDALIFFNFRADRAREITRAFTDDAFTEFERPALPRLSDFVCMTQYDEQFSLPLAYPPVHLENILGQIVSASGLVQLRIAETEKYAHVTYFFNGGEEEPFQNEDRCLIPSPRDIPTYDHKPEMSAPAVTAEVLQRIDSDRYDLIVLNFANMDMVGHTGIMEAAVRACRTVDNCVAEIVTRILAKNGTVIVTADHGNAEEMVDADGNPHTAHTLNPVRLILVDDNRKNVQLQEGRLADIAPTILDIMGLEKPAEMNGQSLIRQ
ncbi:MAG: 2,3-bisphosphoglycerate-independent phosphoglycerate mutase [Desulfobacterales bacterium]|nr:2,3-bisphosphoglycerate-independent phosphoglycerate mutase [Desulfobacterales bacterium]